MNRSTTRHPFALPAVLLSILITSTMALLPNAAGIGASHSLRVGHTPEAAIAQSQHVSIVAAEAQLYPA